MITMHCLLAYWKKRKVNIQIRLYFHTIGINGKLIFSEYSAQMLNNITGRVL